MKSSVYGAITAALAAVLIGLPNADSASAAPIIVPPQEQAPLVPDEQAHKVSYTVRYVDEAGNEVHRTQGEGFQGLTVEVAAEDLFEKGYELFDAAKKPLSLDGEHKEITFTVGKARELMPLTEFLRHPVNYKYPIKFRNLDFTGRQDDLEDFVIKNIYQGNKETGVFYGTKDQAEDIRKTLLNGSFQGAYARYVTNFVPALPKQIGENKYELNIEFKYQEHLEEIKLGEEKITEFVNKYGTDYTDAEKAKLIHDWLMKNTRLYIPPSFDQEWFYNSKGQRRVHFPASLMLDGEGVCLTYAMTYGRLAERMGLEVRLIQGYNGYGPTNRADQVKAFTEKAQAMFDNPDSTTYTPQYLNHTWNLVKIDRAWHHIDTYQDMVVLGYTKKEPHPYRYFLREDDYMRFSTLKMWSGRPERAHDYVVHRAWNTHRIPTAHSAKNEFWVMRDRSQQDMVFDKK